jgi:hypothetical protein
MMSSEKCEKPDPRALEIPLPKLRFACRLPTAHLRRAACLWITVCTLFLIPATASATTDEETDNKLKFYFNMTMMQLIMQAGACSGVTTDNAAAIRQKLEKYMEARGGAAPGSAFDEGIAGIRDKLSALSDADKQYACTEAIRESTRNYEMLRDLYIRRKLDGGLLPPSIDPGLLKP